MPLHADDTDLPPSFASAQEDGANLRRGALRRMLAGILIFIFVSLRRPPISLIRRQRELYRFGQHARTLELHRPSGTPHFLLLLSPDAYDTLQDQL